MPLFIVVSIFKRITLEKNIARIFEGTQKWFHYSYLKKTTTTERERVTEREIYMKWIHDHDDDWDSRQIFLFYFSDSKWCMLNLYWVRLRFILFRIFFYVSIFQVSTTHSWLFEILLLPFLAILLPSHFFKETTFLLPRI